MSSEEPPPPIPLAAIPELKALPPDALADLSRAVDALERTSFAGQMTALAGAPIEALKGWLPERIQHLLDGAVRRALSVAARAALRSKPGREGWLRSAWFHRGLTAASGIAGGAFGLPGTLAELPVSTSLLVRQIAAIALEEGEDAAGPALAAECLKVFALGNRAGSAESEASDYFAVRVALAEALRTAASRGAAGVLMPGFIGAIAARFGGPVALKLSAQAAPIVGAAAGAAVNLAFLEHFRRLARAHFTVRRLERAFGPEPVQHAYATLKARIAPT
jgi:hypothetical protein